MDLRDEILAHARLHPDVEVCGLVITHGDKFRTLRAANLAEDPSRDFYMDPQAWLDVPPGSSVVGVYHSHPFTPPYPSQADLSMCEATGVTWHIVNPSTGGYHSFNPSGFEAPYLRRAYVHGVHDCFSLVRDWYNREWSLNIPDYPRDPWWWEKGENLYLDNYAKHGFVSVSGQHPVEGDLMLIQMRSRVPNHAAVYLRDGTIIHHPMGRLSSVDPWSGFWAQYCSHHLRHESRIK